MRSTPLHPASVISHTQSHWRERAAHASNWHPPCSMTLHAQCVQGHARPFLKVPECLIFWGCGSGHPTHHPSFLTFHFTFPTLHPFSSLTSLQVTLCLFPFPSLPSQSLSQPSLPTRSLIMGYCVHAQPLFQEVPYRLLSNLRFKLQARTKLCQISPCSDPAHFSNKSDLQSEIQGFTFSVLALINLC